MFTHIITRVRRSKVINFIPSSSYAASIKSVSDFIKNRLSVDYQIVSEKDYNIDDLKKEIGLHISDNGNLSKFENNDSTMVGMLDSYEMGFSRGIAIKLTDLTQWKKN